ncbi:SspB family protein [Stella sp.]|uniref:SspB family protein n=1 Tax=Stella sp. TaxID=2912054 RepID=UPI0035B2DB22
MAKDQFNYPALMDGALRGVVRSVLQRTAERGLPGAHHFYISFRTDYPGVEVPEYLREKYPEEITIVLQHQFWGLEAGEDHLAVTLSFRDIHERLVVPWPALTGFADPSVSFGLQFEAPPGVAQGEAKAKVESAAKTEPRPEATMHALPAPTGEPPAGEEARPAAGRTGEVVALDAFRKK